MGYRYHRGHSWRLGPWHVELNLWHLSFARFLWFCDGDESVIGFEIGPKGSDPAFRIERTVKSKVIAELYWRPRELWHKWRNRGRPS